MRYLLLLVSCSNYILSVAQNTLPLSNHNFIVIAHRGNHTTAPENTLLAYEEAIKIGADYVEVDVRTTKDSALVIMHDASINRMTGFVGNIRDFLFNSLQRIKVRDTLHPEWGLHCIPTFKEVLQLCKGKVNIYIDFKDASAASVYKAIINEGMEHNVVVYINTPQQYTDWKLIAPNIPLMISLPNAYITKDDVFDFLDDHPVDVLDGNFNSYNTETAMAAKERGIPIWADIQTQDSENNWNKALLLGLQGLQTDHPQALINFLKKKGIR
jgi:glycerophosphoryl diester phosphodiesterase